MIIPSSSQKLKVSKYLTVYDFVWLCLFLFISTITGILTYKTSHITSITSAIILFVILSGGLVKYGENNLYKIVYLISKHLLTKYLKQSLKWETKIVENNVVRVINKNIEYLSCFKIKGIDFFNLEDEEKEKQIIILKNILDTIDQKYHLIKIDERINLIENATWLNQSAIESNNNQSSIILDKYINKMISDRVDSLKNKTVFCFYIVIVSTNKNQLINIEQNLKNKFIESKLTLSLCDIYKTVNVLKTLSDPSIDNYSKNLIDKNKNDLSFLLNYSSLSIKSNYLKSDKLYLSVNTIKPKINQLCYSWLWPFIVSDTNLVLSSNIVNDNVAEKQIIKSIMNLKTTLHYINKREVANIQKIEILINEYENILKNIASNIDKVSSISVSFINYATSKEELFKKHYNINKIAKEVGFEIDELKYLQKDSLNLIQLNQISSLIKNKKLLISNYDLALGYPYIDNLIIDKKGCYLGNEIYSSQPIIFDSFKIDEKHKNHNMIVFGSTGNGKTTFIKKLIEFNLSANRNIIIIDPENEYKNLSNTFNGASIDASNKIYSYNINPFEIIFCDKQEPYVDVIGVNKNMIKEHIEFIFTWFLTLYPKLSECAIYELEWIIQMMYDNDFYHTSYLYDIKENEWPTYYDLNCIIDEIYKSGENTEAFIELYKILKLDFDLERKSNNQKIYSNCNRMKINQDLTIVNTANFFENYSENKIYGTLFLIMRDIFSQIKKNKNNTNKKTLFVIDEAHIFLDSKNKFMTNFIYQMVKRIRKYNAGIILITQNINDLIADKQILKETSAILNNIQYSVMFNLQANDLNNLTALYSQSQIITEQDKKIIYNLKTGQMMLISHGASKVFVDVEILNKEREI